MSDGWRSCENCARHHCSCENLALWKPISCPRCGGALSETRIYHYSAGPIAKLRKYDGKPYRHCYACHSEFFINEGEEK